MRGDREMLWKNIIEFKNQIDTSSPVPVCYGVNPIVIATRGIGVIVNVSASCCREVLGSSLDHTASY